MFLELKFSSTFFLLSSKSIKKYTFFFSFLFSFKLILFFGMYLEDVYGKITSSWRKAVKRKFIKKPSFWIFKVHIRFTLSGPSCKWKNGPVVCLIQLTNYYLCTEFKRYIIIYQIVQIFYNLFTQFCDHTIMTKRQLSDR